MRRACLSFFAGFLITVAWLMVARKAFSAEDTGPEQPLPYSHKTHLALGFKCLDCHSNPEPGEKMSFPATSRCMVCHRSVAKDRPSILKLAEYSKSDQPIPWVRVYAVPADTYWSHRSHLQVGLRCEQCHGDVAQMERVANVTNVTSMAGCVDCHKQSKAGTGCEFCHEGR